MSSGTLLVYKFLESIKTTLTAHGHTLPQAALAWILARHPRTIPIPGFRTVEQVEENAKTLALGPLSQDQMERIEEIFKERISTAGQSCEVVW